MAAGDSCALAELYDRYAPLLLALVTRVVGGAEVAEEVTQDAFLYAWKRAVDYDPGRSSVSTWLVLIARSRAIDRVRKQQVEKRAEAVIEDEENPWSGPEGETAVFDHQRRRRVRTALAGLPDLQRRVIDLAYYHGLTQSEIARQTAIPLGTVKTRTLLAMRTLRHVLAAEVSELL